MMTRSLLALSLALVLGASTTGALAQGAEEPWLPSLITATPQEGFELAVLLARRGVVTTQPDRDVLGTLRPAYAHDADSLIAASHVIAVHFQTIAAANNHWREESADGE